MDVTEEIYIADDIKYEILKKLTNKTFYKMEQLSEWTYLCQYRKEMAAKKIQRFVRNRKKIQILKFKLLRMIYSVVLNFHEEVKNPSDKLMQYLRILQSEHIAYRNPGFLLCEIANDLKIELIAIVLVRPDKKDKTIGFLYKRDNMNLLYSERNRNAIYIK